MTKRSVLVIGASRGIGLEFVRQFSANPENRVLATLRKPGSSPALAELVKENDILKVDISDEGSINAFAADVKSRVGHVDVVIVNAGVLSTEFSLAATTKAAMLRDFETNTVGPLLTIRALADAGVIGREPGTPGKGPSTKVVVLSSGLGSVSTAPGIPFPNYTYRASKAAVNMVSRLLAVDLAPRGITVRSVHPGLVETDMKRSAPEMKGAISTEVSVNGLIRVLDSDGDPHAAMFNHDGAPLSW